MGRFEQPPGRVAFCNYDWAACERCKHHSVIDWRRCLAGAPRLALEDGHSYIVCESFDPKPEES